jgi:flagellar hook protein FlgE
MSGGRPDRQENVMGIFDALTTAVTGMQAQSFALQNISGNIANSQTTAYKRTETSFEDMLPDAPPRQQPSGSVSASSRATNNVQGDIQTASVGTFMAVNGDGYFVVQKPSGFVDGRPVFDGIDIYTRRGDFQTDKSGFLVNGAGYYLLGIPVDATTGNLVGSVPQLLQFQNDFLPAQPTTQVQYRANLASYPLTHSHDTNIPGSELLNPSAFSANPVAGPPQAAKLAGFGANIQEVTAGVTGTTQFANPAVTQLGAGNGGLLRITVGATDFDVTLADTDTLNSIVAAINGTAGLGAGGAVVASIDTSGGSNQLRLDATSPDVDFSVNTASANSTTTRLGIIEQAYNSRNLLDLGVVGQGDTLGITIGASTTNLTFGTGVGEISTLAELNAALTPPAPTLTGGAASIDATGNLTLTANAITDTITLSGTAATRMSNFGIHTQTALPSNQAVLGQDVSTFIDQSLGGGAITAYDTSGAPVNIQMRWAKTASAAYGGTDTWNLFYQTNSNATGTQVGWQNVGVNYTFGANGQMNPTVANVTLPNVTVDGVALGDVQLVHGSGGITQFADPNGNAQVNQLQQNGFPAGELQSVSVNDKGRVTGTYSNGRTIDLAEITLASFNGPNLLKRLDGGAFAATDESGPAIYGAPGKIVGSSLEGSNTDIADEFSKLIITQQAYSANTRIITTGNQMVQDLLNMIR